MHITIRHAEPEDEEALHRNSLGERFIWGTLMLPFDSRQKTRAFISSASDATYLLVACIENEVVGSSGLHLQTQPRRRHVASLGMGVRDDYQGRGVGSALMDAMVDLADNWLNLIRLELCVWVDNERAIGLYQKFGFVIEGTHSCYAYRNGRYIDAYAMGRIRPSQTARM
ncbi:MAG: GNAT family N-acetyltransferase [Chloroflexaceae bacterium]|nr:GNAT family N-acetyltransferase [Chloroflexaceae bacterium]